MSRVGDRLRRTPCKPNMVCAFAVPPWVIPCNAFQLKAKVTHEKSTLQSTMDWGLRETGVFLNWMEM
jgi:hypothetical protein